MSLEQVEKSVKAREMSSISSEWVLESVDDLVASSPRRFPDLPEVVHGG